MRWCAATDVCGITRGSAWSNLMQSCETSLMDDDLECLSRVRRNSLEKEISEFDVEEQDGAA